jgi:hypothetical protein
MLRSLDRLLIVLTQVQQEIREEIQALKLATDDYS